MRFTSFVVIDTVYRNFLKRSWFVQGESEIPRPITKTVPFPFRRFISVRGRASSTVAIITPTGYRLKS